MFVRRGVMVFCILSIHLSAHSIGVLYNADWRGEHAFALRLKGAGQNLGWKVTLLDVKSPSCIPLGMDWILTLTPDAFVANRSYPNYLVLFDPINHYFDTAYWLSHRWAKYHGYLKTFSQLVHHEQGKGGLIYPDAWYPTVQFRPYERVSLKKLFYFVGQWGNRCIERKYRALETLLSRRDYMCFFGNPKYGMQYCGAYKGEVPYECGSIQEMISQLGVCLVLHSDIHIAHQIPSGRIFEAAASSAVIISDQNPFVQKYFGDSVLYVDQTQSGKEMFAQIDGHMQWILTHQEEALEMARRSYEIFQKHFLLEEQLLRFSQWQQTSLL